ncbi:MAG: M23 family metallopeptidase [Acidobacteria bacterium]|nr:M23 family metallopeptidase [Acidobacteriota bacterium]
MDSRSRDQQKELESIMQKNAKYFTFHFSYTRGSKIHIRKVRVSKGLVQNGLLGVAIIFGLSALSIGAFGILNSAPDVSESLTSSVSKDQSVQSSITGPVALNYSRPDASSRMSFNSGGPALSEDGTEDAEIENQLRVIETTSSPASLPQIWAHIGKINNEFGFRRNPFGGRTYEFHAGMDIDGERGDVIVAPASGTITKSGWQGGYGNMIEIDHGNGLTTRYGHMSKVESAVGDMVTRGQLIGYVGSTGRSTGPHLHYELRLNDRPINPRRFLPPEPTVIPAK